MPQTYELKNLLKLFMKYIILLRGINVGGNNTVKMSDLKSCLENAGFKNVITYINSGNVIVESEKKDLRKLTIEIEKLLTERFKIDLKIVLVDYPSYKAIIENAPKWWNGSPEYRHYLLFIKPPVTSESALKECGEPKEGIEFMTAADGVIYSSALISEISKSTINKIVGKPIYKQMTIRNYNTSLKLLKLMEANPQ